MISIARLRAHLDGVRVVFDKQGDPVDLPLSGVLGPAALLVTPVTDALKRLDEEGHVELSLDRDQMWEVEAIALDEVVLRQLGDADLTVEDLLGAVREAGFAWQISPISAL